MGTSLTAAFLLVFNKSNSRIALIFSVSTILYHTLCGTVNRFASVSQCPGGGMIDAGDFSVAPIHIRAFTDVVQIIDFKHSMLVAATLVMHGRVR